MLWAVIQGTLSLKYRKDEEVKEYFPGRHSEQADSEVAPEMDEAFPFLQKVHAEAPGATA